MVELARIPRQLMTPSVAHIASGVFLGMFAFSLVMAVIWFLLFAALVGGSTTTVP